jgi:glycosyltransferase involved in cell wall biosynthesis
VAEESLREVLVIAYYFPPMGLSGVQRTLKFVKYLPQFGWRPTVLTVDEVGYFAQDDTLLGDLESRNVRIVRIPGAGPGKLYRKKEVVKLPSERMRKFMSRASDTFFIPDNKIGWKKRAVRKALELHRETPFDLIFATAPPFTDFIIGADIKKRINKPLVFDYRDPWVEYPFKFYPTPLHKLWNVALERAALRASSHVVTTNRRVKELLIKRYPFLTYHDVDIIPQGYDPDDFRGAKRASGQAKSKAPARGKMRITYAGVFWEDRVPDHFLKALKQLFDRRPELRTQIEAWFVGHFRDENRQLVSALDLEDVVTVLGYLPHRECIQHLLSSDVLWLVVGDDLGSPGKAYEYIGARKPILGLAPDGFMKSTILEAGGVVVPPKDVDGIEKAIESLFEQFRSRTLKAPPADVVEKYNRVSLTNSLVRVFESLFEP